MVNFVQSKNILGVLILLLILPIGFFFVSPVRIDLPIFKSMFGVGGAREKRIVSVENNQISGLEDGGFVSFTVEGEISRIDFYGGVKEASEISDNVLVLRAANSSHWGYAKLSFKHPVDLTRNSVEFSVKGVRGKELLSVAVADLNRRAAHATKLPQFKIGNDWQNVNIAPQDIKATSIDRSRITHLYFILEPDFSRGGYIELYVKNFTISATKGIENLF